MATWIQSWDVPSSDGSRSYKVSEGMRGEWGCSCPAWTRHTPRRDCKHIKAIKIVREQMKVNIKKEEPVQKSKPARVRKIMM